LSNANPIEIGLARTFFYYIPFLAFKIGEATIPNRRADNVFAAAEAG
jgi:hypothetical protein